MNTRDSTDQLRTDHFFAASQRWLQRNGITAVGLACRADGPPLGTKQLPALRVAGCLAELPLHRLVDLSLAGVDHLTVFEHSCGSDLDADDIAEAWRRTLGGAIHFTVDEPVPSRTPMWSLSPGRVPVDRRGLLGLGRARSAWPTHDPTADDNARLMTSLRAANISSLGQPPVGVALEASGCTACGVCVQACPHDALSIVTEGNVTSLQHLPGACEGEQQCVTLCPVGALTISGPLQWSSVLDGSPQSLATFTTAICQRCRARYPAAPESQFCETCRVRRSDPFGSHLPSAAIDLLRARGHDLPQ